MKKILFLIHDLGQGGAEKVLINLVNNMDRSRFDITVMTLFDVGVNRQFLSPDIKYEYCFKKMPPGNSKIMKLLSPEQLHKLLIREHYDIEVSYLEGPCARVISGCTDPSVRTVCWIHIEQKTRKRFASSFRSYQEAVKCYNRFNRIVTVSESVKADFTSLFHCAVPASVLYNVNESDKIRRMAREPVDDKRFLSSNSDNSDEVRIVGVGKLLRSKGFDRLEKIERRLLHEGYPVRVFVLGTGPEKSNLENYARQHHMEDRFVLLGYQTNPYKYVAKCDLFVCASYAEGFSTAATEALIVGTPVCTVNVSGMKEMLGEHSEYGLVTENSTKALLKGIKELVKDRDRRLFYKEQAKKRGKDFSTEETVKKCEDMFLDL